MTAEVAVGLVALALILTSSWWSRWLDRPPPPVRHWPQEHICGRCRLPWHPTHHCPALHADRMRRPGRDLNRWR
jgi:hypothetical protein